MLADSEHSDKYNNKLQIVRNGVTYRCPVVCPIGKHCFVIKVPEAFTNPLTVLQKCEAKHEDIKITIGGGENA